MSGKSCTATTDSMGVASCSVSGSLPFPAAVTYTASYAGNSDYGPSSATAAIKQ